MSASTLESGAYEYRLNGALTPIRERWLRRRREGGGWLITSSRNAPGVELAVEATADAGRVTDFEVNWRGEGQPGITACYSLLPDRVSVTRSRGGQVTERREIEIAPGLQAPLLSPLMRIFAGPLIARLLENGGAGAVIVPDIRDPQAPETLLLPLLSERQAELMDADSALLVEGVSVPCRRCSYHGDQYRPGTQFWLGANDVLLRYEWRQAQQHWDVRLRGTG